MSTELRDTVTELSEAYSPINALDDQVIYQQVKSDIYRLCVDSSEASGVNLTDFDIGEGMNHLQDLIIRYTQEWENAQLPYPAFLRYAALSIYKLKEKKNV